MRYSVPDGPRQSHCQERYVADMMAADTPPHPRSLSVVIFSRFRICFSFGLDLKTADGNRRRVVDEIREERVVGVFEKYGADVLRERGKP